MLEAFGVTGEPTLLRGGMGRTWRVGDVVLKPVADVVEHAWVAEVYDAWSDPSLLVPHPLRARRSLVVRRLGRPRARPRSQRPRE